MTEYTSHERPTRASAGMSVGSQKFMSLIDRENPVKEDIISDRIVDYIKYNLGRDKKTMDHFGMFQATSASVRCHIIDNWQRTQDKMESSKAKQVAYLSLEFLMGRALGNAVLNLELEEKYSSVMEELGFKMEEIEEEEKDAALGNGGLGRLAACFLDSLACMEMPAWGYGLRYQYGMFRQGIRDGYQTEMPDYWLTHGTPFPQVERLDVVYPVCFFGHVRPENPDRSLPSDPHIWDAGLVVRAVAYDSLCPGHHTRNVANLRLWASRPVNEFSFDEHSRGDFLQAVIDKAESENITMVLYPNDSSERGRELRLKQEFFFVSASLQDIIHRAKEMSVSLSNLGAHFAVQLNDTHPAIGVPELMRLLVDVEGMNWEDAWSVTTSVFAYTNHTVLPEALERWPVPLMTRLLPRHMAIIYEINARYLDEIRVRFPGDERRIRDMSIIDEAGSRFVRMANLAIMGSHHVNGVAEIHSEIIKATIFKDFYELTPDKFVNVTNGVTPRRWMAACNPGLRRFITDNLKSMGVIHNEHEWINHLPKIIHLSSLADNVKACRDILAVKRDAKQRLSDYIARACGVRLETDMLYDTLVKRIHEYKRQLLALFGVIHRYLLLKSLPPSERSKYTPVAHIFAGKAAPGYDKAKRIIKLINAVGDVVNADPDTSPYLKCVFVPNYSVSVAELIFPATDLSEQISTAGHEASGTGCMKAVMNGGIIIGTMDGANIEIGREVGENQIFTFGAMADDVVQLREIFATGKTVVISPGLKAVIDSIRQGTFGDPAYYACLIDDVAAGNDHYLLCYDFDVYLACRSYAEEQYRDKMSWATRMIRAISSMSKFSSDMAIAKYAKLIWNIKPLPVLVHRGERKRISNYLELEDVIEHPGHHSHETHMGK